MEKKISQIYREAQSNLTEKWNAYMKRGQARLDRMSEDSDITLEEYRKALENYTLKNQWYKDMVDETTKRLANVNEIALAYVNDQTPDIYAINYNQAKETADSVGIKFNLVDESTVKRLVRDGDIELPQKKVDIPKDQRWNTKKLNSAVLQGILQGEDMKSIAKRILPVVDYNRKAAIRNARTLVTGAENRGRNDSYKQLSNEGLYMNKVWMATPDGRTRDWHIDMDGQEVSVDDSFVDGLGNLLEYPGDPGGAPESVYNCRCTMVSHVIGFINPETGELTTIDFEDSSTSLHERQMQDEKTRRNKEPVTAVDSFQSKLGAAKTVQEVNDLMNDQGWWRNKEWGINKADLTGCDLDSAKSIAASYEQVFEKYPQLKGKFDAPDAHPVNMEDNTYAWCYLKSNGKVQVNPGPERYGNWKNIVWHYERDVLSGWHPYGTTAESIVTHEIGHAIDGLLAREGVLGGVTISGEYRYASSSLKNTIMNRTAKLDPDVAKYWNAKDWSGKADKYWQSYAVEKNVSRYATKNNREWFAECFAEYITSANPRTVATEFGKELEKLVGRLE